MEVYPLKTESHNLSSLQDFCREVGIPNGLKSDNAKSEISKDWTQWCRKYLISQNFIEPHHPWQNLAENGVHDVARMVKRTMREFGAPLKWHHYCQKWVVDVRNHLASKKLNWRTPKEKLTGVTPDISVFRFHFGNLYGF